MPFATGVTFIAAARAPACRRTGIRRPAWPDETGGAPAILPPAIARAEVALDAAIVEAMPPAGRNAAYVASFHFCTS